MSHPSLRNSAPLCSVPPLRDGEKAAGEAVDGELVHEIVELKLEGSLVDDHPVREYFDDASVVGLLDDPQVERLHSINQQRPDCLFALRVDLRRYA